MCGARTRAQIARALHGPAAILHPALSLRYLRDCSCAQHGAYPAGQPARIDCRRAAGAPCWHHPTTCVRTMCAWRKSVLARPFSAATEYETRRAPQEKAASVSVGEAGSVSYLNVTFPSRTSMSLEHFGRPFLCLISFSGIFPPSRRNERFGSIARRYGVGQQFISCW